MGIDVWPRVGPRELALEFRRWPGAPDGCDAQGQQGQQGQQAEGARPGVAVAGNLKRPGIGE